MIQAVSLLPEEIKKEIVIDVYGDGPYRQQLENQVERLGLGNCFSFMGSSSVLKSIYCMYDYMIQPTHMECFSLSILESLAANIPVITTNVGGNEEVITNGENGFIYQARDSESLQELIKKVYLGEEKITINTRKLVEDYFSLESMVEQHFKLIE